MKNKILIVDDSQVNRQSLADILREDYEIVFANNSTEAISLVKNNLSSLSLIILNWMMAEMNGIEVLSSMNKYHWIDKIPVIIIVTQNLQYPIEHAYELGISDVISLPFHEDIVRKRISNIVSLYSQKTYLKNMKTEQLSDQLDIEKIKNNFFFEKQNQLAFIYDNQLDIMFLSQDASQRLELPEIVAHPMARDSHNRLKVRLTKMIQLAQQTNQTNPSFEYEDIFIIDGKDLLCHFRCRAIWLGEENARFIGVMGFIDKEELFDDEQFQNISKFDLLHFQHFLIEFQKIFDQISLIDVQTQRYISLTNEDIENMYFMEHQDLWQDISMFDSKRYKKAYEHQSKVIHFDFQSRYIYYVIDQYIEVNDDPYVIEYKLKMHEHILKSDKQYRKMVKTLNYMQENIYLDGLTEVYNRRYLEDDLIKKEDITAIAMIDLDHFKDINDCFGHLAGDRALQETAKTIKKSVREKDAVIRYGGDEFIILFYQIPKHILDERLNSIRQEITEIKIKTYPDLKLTCSIGCAYGKYDYQLLKLADKRMYQAKEKRNCVVIDDKEELVKV